MKHFFANPKHSRPTNAGRLVYSLLLIPYPLSPILYPLPLTPYPLPLFYSFYFIKVDVIEQMDNTALTLIRLARYMLRQIRTGGEDGRDSAALRRAFHLTVQVLYGIQTGEIIEKNAQSLIEFLDKSALKGKINERQDASGQRKNGNWITIKGVHVLIDKAGTIVGGPDNLVGSSAFEAKPQEKAKKTPTVTASAYGANKATTGFKDQSAAKRHKKHWKEFGVTSNADYVNHANQLFTKQVGGDIDGYTRPDGTVVRYNLATGEYVAGIPGGTLYTHFMPKWKNGKVSLTKSREYFHEEVKVKGSE